MERTALAKIESWLKRENRKPLIVWGARQVGKTYLIRELFAQRYFKDNFVYVDFKAETEIRQAILNSELVDAKKIVQFLSYYYNRRIDESTLLIFDEIQECLPIISSLKYFRQDLPQIPVIATGSMVRIKLKRYHSYTNREHLEPFFFPVGAIDTITIFPMTFEEYLLNSNKHLLSAITEGYVLKQPLEGYLHDLAIEQLYNYLLVGGMPEVLKTYFDTNSAIEARTVLTDLFENYLNDMDLYQASRESTVRAKAMYKNVYTQLNKEQKNFKSSLVFERLRTRDLKTPLDWLEEAKLVCKSYQLKEHVTLPLVEDDRGNFRLYLSDTGIFAYQSGINMSTFIDKTARNNMSGIFFENYAALELVAQKIPLFYWKGKSSCEFEFIVTINNKPVPIDVKKGKGNLNSLSKYREHNSCDLAVKLSSGNYGFDESKGILTLPLYQLFLFAKDIAHST